MSAFVGIDGGGTKTRGVLGSDHVVLAEHVGPAINVARDGVDQSSQTLFEVVSHLTKSIDPYALSVEAVHAGLSGAGRPDDQRMVAAALLGHLAALSTDEAVPQVVVSDDLLIAHHAAFLGGAGVIIVVGTGSAVYGQRDETVCRAGGWGSTIGDDGSATAIGRASLRIAARAFDDGRSTPLSRLYEQQLGINSISELIRAVYHENIPIQQAPTAIVLQAAASGDHEAIQAVDAEIERLLRQVDCVLTCMRQSPEMAGELPVRIVGGLRNHQYYRERLLQQVADRFRNVELSAAPIDPATGALELARISRSRPKTSSSQQGPSEPQ